MNIVVIEFGGGIELFPSLIQTVDGLLDGGERRIVIDLGALKFINSAALGYLVKTQQRLTKAGGRLALVRVQAVIRKVLTGAHLISLFGLFDSVEAAVASISGPVDHTNPAAAPKITTKTILR